MTGKPRRPFRHRPPHDAFTLVELLVVVALFVLLLALAIPAFSAMLYSSEQSLASNALQTALSAARDAALRSPTGQDAAAAFTYEPGGRLTIVPCILAARTWDEEPIFDPPKLLLRDLFVPLPILEPVQLPRGWMVRGYAPPNTLDDRWYERTYPDLTSRRRGNWLFPETGFFDTESGSPSAMAFDGRDRQTFLVRFEGGTGRLSMADFSPSLVLLPSPATFRLSVSPFNRPGMQADTEPDPARFARRAANAHPSVLTIAEKLQLLGDESSDTVLSRPVSQLAVYNESRLAAALGVRLDPETGTLYEMPSVANQYAPRLVLSGGSPVSTEDINAWIEGRLRVGNTDIPSDARIFTVDHYGGGLQELTGSRP